MSWTLRAAVLSDSAFRSRTSVFAPISSLTLPPSAVHSQWLCGRGADASGRGGSGTWGELPCRQGCSFERLGVPPHREHLGSAFRQGERTKHLESVPHVQRNVRRVGGLQVRRHPGLVDLSKVLRQQPESIAVPPMFGARGQQSQKEVRNTSRVRQVKLFEQVQHPRSLLAKHLGDGCLQGDFLLRGPRLSGAVIGSTPTVARLG